MFEVGFTEILLICGIALLVLGPERLPKLAADLGRWAGRARAMARQLRTQLEQEVPYDPLKEPTRPAPTIHKPAPGAASATEATTRDHGTPGSTSTAADAPQSSPVTPEAAGGTDEPKPA
jgi:sec-independent protein translocase protein TatB